MQYVQNTSDEGDLLTSETGNLFTLKAFYSVRYFGLVRKQVSESIDAFYFLL